MGAQTGSPLAVGAEQLFADPRAVARRVRERLAAETPESAQDLPADEIPAERVLERAHEERDRVLAAGADGLEKLADGRADEIGPDESFGMEAIVLLEGRPAILVQGQDFPAQQGDWAVLNGAREAIRESIRRVGRVEVDGHPSLDWLGTAFVVGPGAVMTNRHVAAEFSRESGAGWTFQEGMSARITPAEEYHRPGEGGAGDGVAYRVTGVIGIHPELDLALLRIEPGGPGPAPAPFPVAADGPQGLTGRPVYCVGYPAYDGRRNEPAAMRRIFMDVYNVKRLQPGTVTDLLPGRTVLTHDCSTLGGNSGSPVVDLQDHRVIGLHFGGRYGVGNYAVPLWRLVDDPLLRRAGVNFV
ncbi:serine protease [Streptomyces sp. NPDC000594]|uniref:trypsin-like serine peptidase n=1 Tax=Streptomyces sp. NPDC000594 TaxID=3154261 RepID=UPI00332C64FA